MLASWSKTSTGGHQSESKEEEEETNISDNNRHGDTSGVCSNVPRLSSWERGKNGGSVVDGSGLCGHQIHRSKQHVNFFILWSCLAWTIGYSAALCELLKRCTNTDKKSAEFRQLRLCLFVHLMLSIERSLAVLLISGFVCYLYPPACNIFPQYITEVILLLPSLGPSDTISLRCTLCCVLITKCYPCQHAKLKWTW